MSLKNRKNLVNCDKIIALTCFTSILEGDISSNLISHLEGLTAVQLAGLKYPSEVHLALSEQEGGEQHKMAGRIEAISQTKVTYKPSKSEPWL